MGLSIAASAASTALAKAATASAVAASAIASHEVNDQLVLGFLKTFLTGMATFMTLAVAGIAAMIAYGQWLVARAKLKFDLFDKRVAMFNAAKALIHDRFDEDGDKHEWEAISILEERMGGARWLISPEAETKLRQFVDEARERLKEPPLERPPSNVDIVAMHKVKLKQKRERQAKDMALLYEMFDPFLSINHRPT